uniref:Formyltetrahydrofolate deformylase n=1 Tax=Arundo donax TaxID=35708 RepID=A0A0A9ES93_ARUDO
MSLKKTSYMIICRSIMVAYHAINVNWEPAFLPSIQQVKQTMVLL